MPSPEPRTGYVMKVYPRFSETFILNEILAHERAGEPVALFSLRPPTDGHFHAALADVRSTATYLDPAKPKSPALLAALGRARTDLAGFDAVLPDLLAAEARDVAQAIALAQAVRQQGIAHLHAHFGTVATTVTRLAARLAGITYSFTAHAKDIFHDDIDQGDLAVKLRDAAAVVTVSDYNLRHLQDRFGADARAVRRIYNGLDLRRFPWTSPADRAPRVVAVGRLVEKKGFADLVLACAALHHQGRQIRCDIIGAGPEHDRLAGLVAAHGLGSHVRLLGPLPQEEVVRHLAGAAAMAVPCVVGTDGNRDGLPTVLLEAMALGTPVVSTDVTGIPEVVRDGDTGLRVDQHDHLALADALGRLLADPALRVTLAERARQRIEADFDVDGQAASLRSAFAGAVARGARGALQGVGA